MGRDSQVVSIKALYYKICAKKGLEYDSSSVLLDVTERNTQLHTILPHDYIH